MYRHFTYIHIDRINLSSNPFPLTIATRNRKTESESPRGTTFVKTFKKKKERKKKSKIVSTTPRTFVHPGNLHQVLRERNLYRKTGTRRDKYLKWPAVLLLVFNAATRIWRNSFPLQSPRNTVQLLLASRRCVLFICIFSNSNTWVSSYVNGWKGMDRILEKLFLL